MLTPLSLECGKGIRRCSVDYRLREFRLFAECPESGNYRWSIAADLTIAVMLAISHSGAFTCPNAQQVVDRLEARGCLCFLKKLEKSHPVPKGIFRQPQLSLSKPVQALSAIVDCADAGMLLFRHDDDFTQDEGPLFSTSSST
jgi:hypothetical protein